MQKYFHNRHIGEILVVLVSTFVVFYALINPLGLSFRSTGLFAVACNLCLFFLWHGVHTKQENEHFDRGLRAFKRDSALPPHLLPGTLSLTHKPQTDILIIDSTAGSPEASNGVAINA